MARGLQLRPGACDLGRNRAVALDDLEVDVHAPAAGVLADVIEQERGDRLAAHGRGVRCFEAFFRDGRQARVTAFELPELADSAGGPVDGELLLETDSGERLEFAAELVHAAPMLMTVDNDYINGVDW